MSYFSCYINHLDAHPFISTEDRAYALALMFGLAVTSGSVRDTLRVAQLLRDGVERLPEKAHLFLNRLEGLSTALTLFVPTPQTIVTDFRVLSIFAASDAAEADYQTASFATDGVYLFIWDGLKCALHKVGTGFHGTIAGNQYAINSEVEAQLRDKLLDNVEELIPPLSAPSAEPAATAPLEAAPAVAAPAGESTARRVRVTERTQMIDIGDGDIALLADGDLDPLYVTEVAPGYEADVFEERTFPSASQFPFYRVGEGRWLVTYNSEPETDEDDDEQEDDEDDDEDELDGGDGDDDSSDEPRAGRGSRRPVIQFIDTVGNESRNLSSTSGAAVHPSSNPNVKKDKPNPAAFKQAWLGCSGGHLYLRMQFLLGPHRMAVFSCSALKLEEVIDIDLPIPELIKAKRVREKRKQQELMERERDGEGKEEAELKEEKEEPQEQKDVEEEGEEEVEWQLGEEVDFCQSKYGASVVAASSNFMISGGRLESNLLLPVTERTGDVTDYVFAENDFTPELTVDLGHLRTLTSIAADFVFLTSKYDVRDEEEDEGDEDGPPSSFVFKVLVSADSVDYSVWNELVCSEAQTFMGLPAADTYAGPKEVRYIRYGFGKLVRGGLEKPAVARRVMAMGRMRVKKVVQAPFPPMCSDGRHLIFIHSKSVAPATTGTTPEEGCEKRSVIETFLVDPLRGMNTQSNATYNCSMTERQLHSCSFASNGERLLITHRRDFGRRAAEEKEVELTFHHLDMITGKQVSVCGLQEITFSKAKGVPHGICYDSRNNMIWGWDDSSMKIIRWRNDGLAPRFGPPRPESEAELLLSTSPQFRLEALSSCPPASRDSATEAAIIVCQLDRLAELHSPPLLPAAESHATNEIEVIGAGFEDPGGPLCRLLVRGQHYGTSDRGFNLLCFDEFLRPGEARSFDTQESSHASERMADFIEAIPEGRLVLVATCDSASGLLSGRAFASLRSLGADKIEKLSLRGSFAMIGRKGATSGSVPQKMADRKLGPVSVRQRLPTPKIPLAVEATSETLSTLVRLITNNYDRLREGKGSTLDKITLMSCFRLLTTNVFQLLRGTPVKKATELFCMSDRATIMRIVMDLINKKPVLQDGDGAIAHAALRLFVTSIDVLYPSAGEKCALLVQYLDAFVQETLSELQRSVLELLLRQMSNPSSLVKLLHGKDEVQVADPMALVHSLLSIAKKETILRLDGLVNKAKQNADVGNNLVGEAAVQMLATLCNLIMSQGAQAIITEDMAKGFDAQTGEMLSCQMLRALADASAEVLKFALEVNGKISNQSGSGSGSVSGPSEHKLDEEVDEIAKVSPVGALMPTVLSALSNLTTAHGGKLILAGLSSLSSSLTNCMDVVQRFLKCVPSKRLVLLPMTEGGARSASQCFESDHPYTANLDRLTEMSFPGALRIVCVFDDRCRTENNYDYVKFWKDSNKLETWHPNIEKFTGRNGSENWPGYGGRPPLVIEGDSAWIEFHTDGSNEDWGWRFTATAEFKKSVSSAQVHWMVELERQMSYCCAAVSSCLVVSVPWDADLEERNAVWVEDNLLEAGFDAYDDLHRSEEDSFLYGLIDRPTESLAAAFCRKMKNEVMEDRGQMEEVNRAVYATCAALIKHNNLVKDALAIASGERMDVSETLAKVWRSGQKMRNFFELGDVRQAVTATASAQATDTLPPMPVLQRGPSIYSFADPTVVKQTSEDVVQRAKFLLRVHVASCVGCAAPVHHWEASPQLTVNQPPTSGASDDKDVKKWDQLVNEVHSSFKLKDMLDYRRKAAQRKGNTTKSTTEKVLRFVQSSVNVENLEKLRQKRNRRAALRVVGFEMLTELVDTQSTPFSLSTYLYTFSRELYRTKRADRIRAHVHFLNGIEGCSAAEHHDVVNKFATFLNKCVNCLALAYKNSRDENFSADERKAWVAAVISIIRACAIDYDLADHAMLEHSNILPVLERILRSDNQDILRTAWSFFEVLLPRCVGLEGQKIDNHDEPSDFSKKLVALLVTELDRASSSVISQHEDRDKGAQESDEDGRTYYEVSKGILGLRRDNLGVAYPHVHLDLQHSFAFWIRRKPCAIEEDIQAHVAREGYRVTRGPHWPADSEDDGGQGGLGTITLVDGTTVSVKWDNKNKKNYKYGAVENGEQKFEVTIVDETLGGVVYCKGTPAILEDSASAQAWSQFGFSISNDAHFEVFVDCGEQQKFVHRTPSIFFPDMWTHVAVVQDRSKSLIYVDGQLASEKNVLPQMLNPGKQVRFVRVIESAHPYRDNMDEYTVVEEPSAKGFTITFDSQVNSSFLL